MTSVSEELKERRNPRVGETWLWRGHGIDTLLAQLRALATERDISVAELVRRAVEEYLKRQK